MAPTGVAPTLDDKALRDLIAARIRADGPITFRDFMDLALYHPEHGYYSTCDPSLDYQSSPNVHPVFAWCLAGRLSEMWALLGRPARFDVVEAGAGSGRLAADTIGWLQRLDPAASEALRYRLQDRTYADDERARRVRCRPVLEAADAAVSADLPGPGTVHGCILSNELVDAFPVHRVRAERGRLLELMVGLDGDSFVDVPAEPSPEVLAYFDTLQLRPGEGCEGEVNLEAAPWIRKAAASLDRGYVLTLDYGYQASEMWTPQRRSGTLLTFFRHMAGADPYQRVGRQDITASVDFTTFAGAGAEAGLSTLSLTTQAEFLVRAGIGSTIARRPERNELEAYHSLRRAVLELTDMAGLGRMKVLLQGRDVPATPPSGFSEGTAGD